MSSDRRDNSSRNRLLVVLATPLGLLASGVLVWHSTYSAFSGTTSNSGNSFSVGGVSLTDDDSGSAMFTATGLKPGSTGASCITVTYGGNVTSAVKLYVATGDLTDSHTAAYLNIVIEEGSGGPFNTCTSFAATATDYTGTLSAFAASDTNFGTGVGAWTPTAAAQTKSYRITYTLADNNAAQNGTATVKFTWEAQNT